MTTQSSDPFEALEVAAHRMAEEKAADVISTARTKLVMGKDAKSVFFATLALGLMPKASWDRGIDTMATDGKHLFYNPEWVGELSLSKSIGVVAHETCHVAYEHHARRGDREPRKSNIAADLAINDILTEAGFDLPECGLFPGKGEYVHLPKGLSFEEYYALLPDEPEEDGGGGNDPGGCGGFIDPGDGSPAAIKAAKQEAAVAVAQAAAAAKQRGALPAGIALLVDEILAPQVDWRDVLREFIGKHVAKDDYSWATPNRRFIGQGMYLPGMKSEAKPSVALLVDTSGSVGPKELAKFAGELAGMLEASPYKLWIGYHDTMVHHTQEWSSGEGDLSLEAMGGGGTSHQEPFERIAKDEIDPDCVICLTDLCTEFPNSPPPYPVIWVSTEGGHQVPFGEVIVLK